MTRLFSKRSKTIAAILLAAMLTGGPASLRAQYYPAFPPGGVGPPAVGQTPGGTLRNAVNAVHQQVGIARNAARYWARQANGAGYQSQFAIQDFQNTVNPFQGLRQQFAWLASIVAQQQRPRAANAVAELSAGLDIVAEIFEPVQQQLNAGIFDRNAVGRMCRALDEALGVWDQELTKDASRLSFAW